MSLTYCKHTSTVYRLDLPTLADSTANTHDVISRSRNPSFNTSWEDLRKMLEKWPNLQTSQEKSYDGDADAAVEARVRIGRNKFRQSVPLLTNKDVSLIMTGRLYSSCVLSSMSHGRKENEVALRWAEMRMVRWMCSLQLNSRFPSKELRARLGIDDTALVLQQNRLLWYGHVMWKDNNDDWVKKCMEYEAEGPRPRGRPKRTWTEVVKKDCQTRKLNKE